MSKRKQEAPKKCRASLEELASLYTGVYNLFEGVDKRTLVDHIRGRKPDSRILKRQQFLLAELVKVIDNNLSEPSNLSATLQPIEIKEDKVLKILEKINIRL